MENKVTFTLQDLAKAAISNEKKGSHFYATMAQLAENKTTKDMFHKLAEEELEHKRLFEKVLAPAIKNEEFEPLDSTTGNYLATFFKVNIFPQIPLEHSKGPLNALSALQIGIQAEKDSILLYQELYNRSKSTNVKDLLSNLLEQEKMHLVELRQQLEELSENT